MNAPETLSTSSKWALCQFDPQSRSQSKSGHYESFFLRANHPTEPRAFWIRYTIFSPKNKPEQAIGEMWAIYFDGTKSDSGQQRVVTVQEDIPMSKCHFDRDSLNLTIGRSILEKDRLEGLVKFKDHKIEWNLTYQGGQPELFLLPENLYGTPLPKAKSMVGSPNALFNGSLIVDGEMIDISDWQGSENHNWGSKHTDEYAWGQVAGFDNAPDAFLEVATAKIKLGPIWSPPMTLAIVRVGGREYRFNSLKQAFKADGKYDYFNWSFAMDNGSATLKGTIGGEQAHFTGLTYKNPPGGTHTCLNSKIAACEITLEGRGQPLIHLKANNRAAFEILTDNTDHGLTIVN
jgi:hypothetical protein